MKRTLIYLATFLLCGGLFLSPHAWAFDREKEARTVTVTGNGSVDVVPDIARVWMGVSIEGMDIESITAAARYDMSAVLDALKSKGIAPKDMQTQGFSVTPKIVWDSKNGPHSVGYTVSNQVRVTLRDLARIGEVLSAALKAGANRVNGPQFDISDRQKVERRALSLAMSDARERASLLAQSSGSVLGEALIIQEGARGFPIRPMMGAMAMKNAAPAEPISVGEETVSASVTVTYSLK